MTAPEQTDERLRVAFAKLADRVTPRAACPDPERLWDAVCGEASPEETRALGLHAIECPSCGEAWRLAREFSPGSESATAAGPASSGTWWRLAAAAALLIGAFLVLNPHLPYRLVEDPNYRRGVKSAITSSLEEGAAMPRDAFVLRWSGPEGAVYRVDAADGELLSLAEGRDLREPVFTVPAEALRDVESGSRVIWQVSARLPDGSEIRSPSFVAVLE